MFTYWRVEITLMELWLVCLKILKFIAALLYNVSQLMDVHYGKPRNVFLSLDPFEMLEYLRFKGFGKRRREMERSLFRLQLSFLFGRGKTNTLCEKSLPPGFALIFHVGAFWCKPDWVPKTGVQVSKTHVSKASPEKAKKKRECSFKNFFPPEESMWYWGNFDLGCTEEPNNSEGHMMAQRRLL